jgi:hypothetical protein
MKTPLASFSRLTILSALGLLLTQVHCVGFGEGQLGAVTCPELYGAGSVLGANFSADARANAKVRTFVQASKDLLNVSLQMEAEATEACTRMGMDLGLNPAQMAPQQGNGGRAAGACNAVAARIDAILRQGVQVQVQATPPRCQANASAAAACQGSCSASGQANGATTSGASASGDAECDASCRAHADVNASCSPAMVNVRASGTDQAARLAATLQANLPLLLHAELALGRRLIADLDTVGQVGAQLPRIAGNAGARALACVGAGASAAASASVRVKVSVQASASVSGRVGSTLSRSFYSPGDWTDPLAPGLWRRLSA